MYKSDFFELADHSKGTYYPLEQLESMYSVDVQNLPYTIRVLLESAMRNHDDFLVTEKDVKNILNWTKDGERMEIPFLPSRVILQDFTGVPAVVDLASMRDAVKKSNGNPSLINPQCQTDLVIDHSVMVDHHGSEKSMELNTKLEYSRNSERYRLLKWGQKAFKNF